MTTSIIFRQRVKPKSLQRELQAKLSRRESQQRITASSLEAQGITKRGKQKVVTPPYSQSQMPGI